MKRTRERERSTDELERDEAQPSPPPTAATAELLELQRSVGNRAVAAMLARDTTKAPPKPKGGDGGKAAEATGPRVVIPDVGVIPIESMQWGQSQGPPSGGGGGDANAPKEIHFTSKVGEHSSALMKEALYGTAKDVEIIWPGSSGVIHIKLTAALVSSYSTSGGGDAPMESWALNFQSMEFQQEEGGEKKE